MRDIQQAARADLALQAQEAEPTAIVAYVISRVNGSKTAQPRDFNPAAQTLYRLEARETVNAKAARLFMDLVATGELASWVPGAIDIELIKAAAEND